ncbi:hypothetical protein N748_08795 [Legionella pneumophila str. 121004]|nr:hypothetical protein N748_08795 [Legionella pneumophila str. 121004]ERH42720.1 hypothetical protein N750_14325 [Legionella pneumophila str. Leg01/53]
MEYYYLDLLQLKSRIKTIKLDMNPNRNAGMFTKVSLLYVKANR